MYPSEEQRVAKPIDLAARDRGLTYLYKKILLSSLSWWMPVISRAMMANPASTGDQSLRSRFRKRKRFFQSAGFRESLCKRGRRFKVLTCDFLPSAAFGGAPYSVD
jgi:hypothetical protein